MTIGIPQYNLKKFEEFEGPCAALGQPPQFILFGTIGIHECESNLDVHHGLQLNCQYEFKIKLDLKKFLQIVDFLARDHTIYHINVEIKALTLKLNSYFVDIIV